MEDGDTSHEGQVPLILVFFVNLAIGAEKIAEIHRYRLRQTTT